MGLRKIVVWISLIGSINCSYGKWGVVSKSIHHANGRNEVGNLLNRYHGAILRAYENESCDRYTSYCDNFSQVSYMSVTQVKYRFFGDHSCSRDDSRLIYFAYGFEFHEIYTNGRHISRYGIRAPEEEGDPCRGNRN